MTEAVRATVDAMLDPAHVALGVRAADKPAVIAEVGRRAAAALGLAPAAVIAALTAREALGSTGVGGGIALPHARVEGVSAPAGFLARLEMPVEFGAIDGRKVDLVFVLLSPVQGNAAHLAALALVARRLRDGGRAAAIRAARSPAAARDLLAAEAAA